MRLHGTPALIAQHQQPLCCTPIASEHTPEAAGCWLLGRAAGLRLAVVCTHIPPGCDGQGPCAASDTLHSHTGRSSAHILRVAVRSSAYYQSNVGTESDCGHGPRFCERDTIAALRLLPKLLAQPGEGQSEGRAAPMMHNTRCCPDQCATHAAWPCWRQAGMPCAACRPAMHTVCSTHHLQHRGVFRQPGPEDA